MNYQSNQGCLAILLGSWYLVAALDDLSMTVLPETCINQLAVVKHLSECLMECADNQALRHQASDWTK